MILFYIKNNSLLFVKIMEEIFTMEKTILIDKETIGFDKNFCHKVFRKRNKFLEINNLPKITFTGVIPKSYCPINFINNINDEIYEKIENNILKTFASIYELNENDLEHNVSYYVENNSYETKIYEHLNHTNYSYGYLILLNENTYYEGGEVYVNDNKVDIENKILFFKLQDRIEITNIIEGEQHKLIGFVNYCYNENNNIIDSFKSKKLNICKNKNHIFNINELLIKDQGVNYVKKILDFENNNSVQNEDGKKYIILNDFQNVMSYNKIFSDKFNELITILSNYNLDYKNMLPIKLCKFENKKQLYYFKPLIRDSKYNTNNLQIFQELDSELLKNCAIKFTVFICINEIKGKIIFPNQNLSFDLYNGVGIVIPNHFIYSFYITLQDKNIIEDSICFIELSFY